MASEASSSMVMAQQRSLADMPKAWLQQLMLCGRLLKPQNRAEIHTWEDEQRAWWRSISQTCWTFRDLALRHNRWLVKLRPSPTPVDLDHLGDQLAVACKYSSEVDFWLDYPYVRPWQKRAPAAEVSANASALLHAARARGARLESIKTVQLAMISCNFDAPPPAPSTTPVCTQLQSLTVYQLDSNSMPVAVWAQQLRTLPNLKQLDYCTTTDHRGWDGFPELLVAFSTIGSQLTSLTCLGPTSSQLRWPLLPTWFPRIHTLELPPLLVVDDEALEALLCISTLRHLAYHSLQLQRSYTQRALPWTQLGFAHIDIASLARLPLEGLQHMRLCAGSGEGHANVVPSSTLADNSRVAAAAARCGGLEARGFCRDLRVLNGRSKADCACLEAVLPMLSAFVDYSSLGLEGALSITPQLLRAMGQHIPASINCIEFHRCTWRPEAWPCLLPSLPHTRASATGWPRLLKPRVHLVCTPNHPTEAQLIEMCLHATSPVGVVIINPAAGQLEEGWKERVRAAMTAAGQLHVALEQQGG